MSTGNVAVSCLDSLGAYRDIKKRDSESVPNYFSPCISQEIKKTFKHSSISPMDMHGMVWLQSRLFLPPPPLPQAENQCGGDLANVQR
jgi:hypothetical protein